MSEPIDLFERQDLGAFDGDKRRERLEMAYQMRLMTDMEGWRILEQLVAAELAMWERRILAGGLDPEAYRHKTGYALGLRHAIETPEEFQKQVLREQAGQTEGSSDE